MKKNKMMRLASIMMVMTLMTTSVISGTFAKYVTSDDASDSARVAKWGVTVLAGGSLFGENYMPKTVEVGETPDIISAEVKYSVDSTGGNIVAPGTKSAKGLVLNVYGTPEVAYKVELTSKEDDNKDIWLLQGIYYRLVDATAYVNKDNVTNYYEWVTDKYVKATEWKTDAKYYELSKALEVTGNATEPVGTGSVEVTTYNPLKWSISDIATTYRNIDDVIDVLKNTFKAENGKAGVAADKNYVVSWTWDFSGQDDEGDTILGDLQAAGTNYVIVKGSEADGFTALVANTDYCLDVAINASITVEQVD